MSHTLESGLVTFKGLPMNRRQALARLAALFGAGVAAPAMLAAEAPASASLHLARAKAWKALAGFARPNGSEINIYINPWEPNDPAYQKNVMSAMRMARERFGENARVSLRKCVSNDLPGPP